MSNIEIAKTDTSVDLAQQMAGLSQLANFLITENLVPKRKLPYSISEVMTMLAYGRQLNMDPITSVNSLEFIEGTLSLKSKMIAGVLARAGVAIRVIKDYEPIYEDVPVTIKGSDGKPLVDEEGKMKYYLNPDGSIYYKKQEIDRETVIEFVRYFDKIGLVTNQMSYKLSYAKMADLSDKANWQKNRPYMMFARCLSRGARAFASDIISGLYDELEVLDFSPQPTPDKKKAYTETPMSYKDPEPQDFD